MKDVEQNPDQLIEQYPQIYQSIINTMCHFTGVDFTQYKESTLMRRIERRRGIVQAGSLNNYWKLLKDSPEEKECLYQDILIGVTDFFRDIDAYISLYHNYIKSFLSGGTEEIRIWCIACSSGEEPYSMAVLMSEAMKGLERQIEVKIFATDIDGEAVNTAKRGIYSEEACESFPDELKKTYFIKQEKGYKICDQIRRMVVFARHDVIKDPPFSHMDLVICRNVFIYIKPKRQQSILNMMYRVLNEEGVLFLGSSESLGALEEKFQVLDKRWRIYRKKPNKDGIHENGMETGSESRNHHSRGGSLQLQDRKLESEALVEQIMDSLTRTAVVVDKNGEVLRMVKEDERDSNSTGNQQEKNAVEQLEKALRETSGHLQRAVEELEIKNEELLSANEEMIVFNEELQSANEELQSVNDELFGINADYQGKISELTKANMDFDNLLMNAEVGALYIDDHMLIRKITPIMCKNTNLLMADLGRPISHVRFMDEYHELEHDVKKCMELQNCTEREILKEGVTFLLRFRPYFISEGVSAGVLVILFDITKRLEAVKLELQILNDSIPGGVARMRYDNGLIIEYGNEGLYRLIQLTREEALEKYHNHYEKVMYKEDWEKLQGLIESSVKSREIISMEYRVSVGCHINEWRLIQAEILEDGDGRPLLQCVITSITETKNVQLQLDSMIQNSVAGILRVQIRGQKLETEYISDRVEDIVGYSKAEISHYISRIHTGKNLVSKEQARLALSATQRLIQGEPSVQFECLIHKKNKEYIWIELKGAAVARTAKGIVIQYILTDITEAKHTFLSLEKERKKLSAVVEMTGEQIFEYDLKKDLMNYSKAGEGILYHEKMKEQYIAQIVELKDPVQKMEGMKLAEALKSGRESFRMDFCKYEPDGSYHWLDITARTFYDQNGKPERVLGRTRNIDEQKHKEAKLRERSRKDSLTGLLNHMTVKKEITKRLSEERNGEEAYLIICDIDNFKQVNDTNGHLFGDAVICCFADEMMNLFPDALLGRIGGDEFIIYADTVGRQELEDLLIQLNRSIVDQFKDDRVRINVSCSLGGVVLNDRIHEYDHAFQWADSALYQVKNSGKGAFILKEMGDETACSEKRYLAGSQNKDDYVRVEALIRNQEELVLFCVDLLENVAEITSALKMICDRTCQFLAFDDMVFVEHREGKNHVLYQWCRVQKQEYTQRMMGEDIYNYKVLSRKANEQGILIYREKDTVAIETERAKSVMIAVSRDYRECQYSIVFADRNMDRDWEAEKEILCRISNIVFGRLHQLLLEEKDKEELDRRLNYDELTGLSRYQSFLIKAEQYRQGERKKKLFCFYSDFSNFQYLNEIYGYEEGDRVLQEFAAALRADCSSGVLFSRVTSDHFVGILEGDSLEWMKESMLLFSENLCHQLGMRYSLCKLALVSGLYEEKGGESSIAYMLDCANEARKKGKEQKIFSVVTVYTDQIRQQSERIKGIVARMVPAYENKEFYAYLQPKVSLTTGRIIGAEALVRWIRPDGTFMMPDEFIGIFERNGFITRIDFCVLEQVLEYLKEALHMGEEVVPISVNFSRRHNEFDNFVSSIFTRLSKYQVPPDLLEAEITESVFMSDLSKLKTNIARLREGGVQIDIDDFGSGYSSLNVLTRVSADIIKLDKQFLSYHNDEAASPAVVKYLIRMLKALGYKVIAEGVETREQADMLRLSDCDCAQGYYFARPMPIEEFRNFLKKFNSNKKD